MNPDQRAFLKASATPSETGPGARGWPQNDRLDWYLEYTAKEAYGMTGLAPQDWHTMALRLQTEPALFQEYYTYKYKSYLGDRSCTGTCIDTEVCGLRSSYVGQPGCA